VPSRRDGVAIDCHEERTSMWGDYMNHMGGGWGMHGFGLVWMVLFWALVIAAVYFLVRAFIGNGADRSDNSGDRALEILEERFARGELTREEFEEKLQTLRRQ
jgi:putative membrane protein